MGKFGRNVGVAALGVAGALVLAEAGQAQNEKAHEYRQELTETARGVVDANGNPVVLGRFQISQREFDGAGEARDKSLDAYGVFADDPSVKEKAAAVCLLLTAGKVTWSPDVVDEYTIAVNAEEVDNDPVEAATAYTAAGELCMRQLPNHEGVVLKYIDGYPEE